MPRFFMPKEEIAPDSFTLSKENAAHLRVLRLKNGDAVTVCDGAGTDYECLIEDGNSGRLSVTCVSPSKSEPQVFASVYMAFAKSDKFEHVIQKATELGASEVVCFPSSRCVSRPDERSLKAKLDRWSKIAASAAGQSGRGVIPQIIALPSYAAALARAASAALAVCFYENEKSLTYCAAISQKPFRTASILTGPEGGFSEEEIRQAAAAGLQICTLGRRILRCETAPLCALSALMYATGEF
ncbi:MAG: 16S rRNA (uracil(1498)-N(3))-methyltransferase [Oscillospiraceae bacterium]|jgi:16S rRNA (uracil1498-N3)-methyltransferase|nr:16S rRNA (uracil(1498)-N(3))-methyltransferase [Oscillospiraceae bacterium]